MKTPTPPPQKPRACSSGWSWPTAVATDSSMVTCACSSLRHPLGANIWFIWAP